MVIPLNKKIDLGQRNTQKAKAIGWQMAGQILRRYLLTLLVSLGAFILFVAASWKVLSLVTWYSDDGYWPLLHFLRVHVYLISLFVCVGIWLLVTIVFLYRIFHYLDEVVLASQQLVQETDRAIELPPELGNIQNQLNLVREQALRNAMAAKEAEQRKNDLIVYLAHDLKTPLTSVIGYLTLLKDEPQISEGLRAKYTQIAWNKALRLEDLINEFFDITRFNLSVMTLEKETIHLSRMLEQLSYEFIPILQQKGLSWNLQIAEGIELSGDADKLERVFDNLIRNAVNYSYPDTALCLSLQYCEAEKKVQVCLENHGKTIAPEKLAHIFERFFRADASRTSATGGAGLGLAIAKEIVQLHGGQIQAESENETIRFTVLLPSE